MTGVRILSDEELRAMSRTPDGRTVVLSAISHMRDVVARAQIEIDRCQLALDETRAKLQ